MAYSVLNGPVGNPQLTPFNLPDTTERAQSGLLMEAIDPYWGGGEFVYCRAAGVIRQFALVVVTPVLLGGKYVFNVTEVPNTAGLGRSIGVAMVPATAAGQFIAVCVRGVVPVNCNAAIVADTAFGIAAAGQGGALTAGKQVLNARIVAASSTTVAKAGSTANSGSTRLLVSSADGWFAGAYLSGTGIAALTTVVDIDPSGTVVTLSVATTAAVNGTVTATYNNAVVFYNVAHLNRALAQGQIL